MPPTQRPTGQRPADVRPLRAEPSDGDRTTLRVPPDLVVAADHLAEQHAVTRNAALISLARRGRDGLEADARLGELRMRIEQAVLGEPAVDGIDDLPTPDEYAAAILAPRGQRPSSP